MFHHTRVLINPRAYENNLRRLAALLSGGCQLCAVLKADAYGHGLELLAPIADACGAQVIGFGDNWEADAIRRLGIARRLIRLRPAALEEAREALACNVEEVVGSLEQATIYSRLGTKQKKAVPVHLKLDVGIGRMGFDFTHQEPLLRQTCALPGLRIAGVMTHFPCADEEDLSFTQEQLDQFLSGCRRISGLIPSDAVIHAANSAAALRIPASHQQMVRLGIATFGLSPSKEIHPPLPFEPVMRVVTQVVQVRDVRRGTSIGYGMLYRAVRNQRIATLPVGYANGYIRDFSNYAWVLIHGKRCPVVGRISMNMITVDVTTLQNVQIGDEAVLLGKQGEESITAEEMAAWVQTINYEITCLLGACNRMSRFLEKEE